MKMKFSHMEDMKDDYPDVNTHCVFGVATKIPFRLNQNQALLTFEDEEGMMHILSIKLMSLTYFIAKGKILTSTFGEKKKINNSQRKNTQRTVHYCVPSSRK